MTTSCTCRLPTLLSGLLLSGRLVWAGEAPYIYGIFGYDPSNPADNPAEYMGHISSGAGPGWVTSTAKVGANTNNVPRVDFTPLSKQGHTVICRINHGYFPEGTIPLPAAYDDFARCCALFVSNSPGCAIWTIGNELNIAGEWPYDPVAGRMTYVTPASYASCFRKVYNAIKAVHPNDKVLPAAPACFSGPFSAGPIGTWQGTNYYSDANPLSWVDHLNALLTAIRNTGPLDGIALHVSSRGYQCSDVHSNQKVNVGGRSLYWSFYTYKDWVTYGIPPSLYHLPLYATEGNGYYYWKGGHPEDVTQHYEPGWMQEVYAEISRYNQNAAASGKPVYRCLNLYRWADGIDGWNINNQYYKDQILRDLDEAVAQKYTWPSSYAGMLLPVGLNFLEPPGDNQVLDPCNDPVAGVVPQKGWVNLTQGGTGTGVDAGGGISVTWATAGGGTHAFSLAAFPYTGGDYDLIRGYLDTGDATTNTLTVSGLKFPLYDVIAYSDGDNGSATRVARFTLRGAQISATSKYVRDDADMNFYGTYTEADSTSPAGASGNYCRFRNARGSSFTLTGTGQSGSDGHPRGPLNAIQIIPVNVVPVLSDPSYSQFQFFLSGTTNASYGIETSTNLANWTALGTYTAPTQVALPGTDARRFYRALQISVSDDVPVLSNPTYRGQFQFYLSGATNMNYVIQASTNLVNWLPVATNRAPGRITLPAAAYPRRFYRALFQ